MCASPASAQQQKSGQPYYRYLGEPAGLRYYVRDRWGIVSVEVINPTNEPVELLATTHVGNKSSLQYARELWVPAGGIRRTAYPLQMAADIPPSSQFVEINSLLFDTTDGEERMIERQEGPILQSQLLPLLPRYGFSAMLTDARERGGTDRRHSFEAVTSMRVAEGKSRRVLTFEGDFLPATALSLDGLDHLIVANDSFANDSAGLTAIRHWLQGGRKMWVMLDEVEPETVNRLFGDAFDWQIVDSINLTEVKFEHPESPWPGSTPPEHETLQFDEPVKFLRVLADDVEVVHTVNGWPASFWMNYGEGQVLFTTLGASAWIHPRRPEDPQPTNEELWAPYAAEPALRDLGGRFLLDQEEPALIAEKFEPYLNEQVGYKIVGRGPVTGMLGGFCAAVLIAGVWFARRRQLQHLGWFAPVAAVVAATALVITGMQAREAVPPTVATAEYIDVVPGSYDIRAQGMLAIYNQEESDEAIGVRRGGLLWPDMQGLENVNRRMMWTDFDAYRWHNLTLPTGMRTAPFEYTGKVGKPLTIEGTFGPDGFTGTVDSGSFGELSDGLIVRNADQRMWANLRSDGKLSAGPDDMLAIGQYVGVNVLSDAQREHQALYRDLSGDLLAKTLHKPHLLAWAKPVDLHFQLPENSRRVGAALVSVPIAISRPESGTDVSIPSPFLTVRPISNPYQEGNEVSLSTAFDYRTGEWNESTNAMQAWLRFELPQTLLPMTVDRAEMAIEINAPQRSFEVLGSGPDGPVSLASENSPVGAFRFEIDRADLLKLDADGGLRLGLAIGSSSGDADTGMVGGSDNPWKVEYLHLDVTGTVTEKDLAETGDENGQE